MAAKIRLQRVGSRGQPKYRLVVQSRSAPRNGAVLEIIGHYNPRSGDRRWSYDKERLSYWLGRGAEVSDAVRTFLLAEGMVTLSPAEQKMRERSWEQSRARQIAEAENKEELATPAPSKEKEEAAPKST